MSAQVQKLQTLLERVQTRRAQPRPVRAVPSAAARSTPRAPASGATLEEALRAESDKPPRPDTPVPTAAPSPARVPTPVPEAETPSLPPAPVRPEPLELDELENTGPDPLAPSNTDEVEAISLPSESPAPLELEQHAPQADGPSTSFEPQIAASRGKPVKVKGAVQPVEALTFGGLLELSLSLRPKE